EREGRREGAVQVGKADGQGVAVKALDAPCRCIRAVASKVDCLRLGAHVQGERLAVVNPPVVVTPADAVARDERCSPLPAALTVIDVEPPTVQLFVAGENPLPLPPPHLPTLPVLARLLFPPA